MDKNKLNRQNERFNQKVNSHLESFVNSYIEKFMNPESTDDDVDKYELFLTNRWKTYCHINRLNKQAFVILGDILNRHKETYAKSKAGELELPAEVTEKEPEPITETL